jgi:integrase
MAIVKDAMAARRISPQSDLPLSKLAETYTKERGATASVNRETAVAVRLLEECLGEASPVYQLTRSDILAFKRALAETPANYVSRFPNTTLPDAIKANKQRKSPYPCPSARTIGNKYLSRIHSLLGWCVQNDILPDSPATGIKVDSVRKSQPPRVNFAPSDLSKIFSSKRFDVSKPLSERQWAELLSLFTGARASELGQVRIDSIRTERGVLVMRIEEATKNRNSQRLVPIHDTLMQLGLERYLQQLRQKSATHLFPVWHQKSSKAKINATTDDGMALLNHYYPRYYPKAFNHELRKIGITDRRMSWHSFRHTFRTGLELAGVPKPTADRLTGHVDGSMASVYTHAVSVEVLKEAIDRLRYDGFEL